MLDYLGYRFNLIKLFSERRKIRKDISLPVPGEPHAPDYDDYASLSFVEHKIYRLTSDFYWEQAFKSGVPIPSGAGVWENNEAYPGTQHLSRKAISEIQEAIHTKKSRRHEVATKWMLTATGLVGAITGLASVLID